jgi:hypothetical protein
LSTLAATLFAKRPLTAAQAIEELGVNTVVFREGADVNDVVRDDAVDDSFSPCSAP